MRSATSHPFPLLEWCNDPIYRRLWSQWRLKQPLRLAHAVKVARLVGSIQQPDNHVRRHRVVYPHTVRSVSVFDHANRIRSGLDGEWSIQDGRRYEISWRIKEHRVSGLFESGDGLLRVPNPESAFVPCGLHFAEAALVGHLRRQTFFITKSEGLEPLSDFVRCVAEQLSKLSQRNVFESKCHCSPFAC